MLVSIALVIGTGVVVIGHEYKKALDSRAQAIAISLQLQLQRLLSLQIPLHDLVGFDRQCEETVNSYAGIEHAMVVDRNGLILFRNDAHDRKETITDAGLLAVIKAGKNRSVGFSIEGHEDYGAVVPVRDVAGNLQAAVIVGFHKSLVDEKLNGMALTNAGIGVLLLLLGIVILLLTLSRLVTTPLGELLASIEVLRSGRFDLSKRLAVPGEGEIGELATAFNGLIQALQDTVVSKAELEKAEERYRLVVESSPTAIFVLSGERIVLANQAAMRLLKARQAEQLLGHPFLSFVTPESRQAVQQYIQQPLDEGRTVQVSDIHLSDLDGGELEVEITRNSFSYNGVSAEQIVVHDLTELRQQAAALEYLASHDVLTGLSNRAELISRMVDAIAYAKRHERQTTVVFLDLDNFKLINDSLGHDQGDALLKECAKRLTACVRDVDVVARLGGDEFVIILFDMPTSDSSVITILQRILESIAQPVVLSGGEYSVSTSIGFAVYPRDGTTPMELMRNADEAMYRAKESGRNNFQPYSEELHKLITARLEVQSDLKRAVEHDEFVVYYQPQADARSGEIFGAEALVRWCHPERGIVMPNDFIQIAEDTGLINEIGEYVLRAACAQAKAWHAAGFPSFRVAVNLSPRQFWQQNLVQVVRRILRETQLDPSYLELELTESLIMKNVDEAVKTMWRLRDLGVTLAVDDFGTGYSSLEALQHFPITRLKIAQEFLREIPRNLDTMAIARSVIALGHNMNLRVIAEGVENVEQLRFLRDSGCDEIQGHLISMPVPGDEFFALMLDKTNPLAGLE